MEAKEWKGEGGGRGARGDDSEVEGKDWSARRTQVNATSAARWWPRPFLIAFGHDLVRGARQQIDCSDKPQLLVLHN